MNFFFGYNDNNIRSKISIPKFQNSGKYDQRIKLFSASIENSSWIIKQEKLKESIHFFNIESNNIDNQKIFFIAYENEVNQYLNSNKGETLEDINNFTNTAPSYRCNLKVYKNNEGYSSYQSDYPFKMTNKSGSIFSSLFLLTNKNADRNYILIRNIFHKPIIENFDFYIVDTYEKKILYKQEIKSNFSNLVEIKKEFIGENSYIFTKKHIGIPIYISILDSNFSFEHTHSPHTYILSKRKYELVEKIKKQIDEIVN